MIVDSGLFFGQPCTLQLRGSRPVSDITDEGNAQNI